jgi:hypothetical protein
MDCYNKQAMLHLNHGIPLGFVRYNDSEQIETSCKFEELTIKTVSCKKHVKPLPRRPMDIWAQLVRTHELPKASFAVFLAYTV